ncbi:hypothetical protein H6F42_10620 [Pseudanabaena sp. FACHB-1998]|uniref:hypothetical protein n=1 Tax=Pseudanabaena sp. FACHB-1998 TaxID=2692858 RepID=UPI001680B40D|nr:hypothetical protein [Pseudanabaena sp. FACHB-1998]MBD2177364.1 hypothetical protein [Pseudanabaena sp. FACHB-1998]
MHSYKNDPLASFLINKCKLNPISFAVVSVITTFVVFVTIAWYTNTLVSTKDGQIGFWQDPSIWVWEFLFKPVLLGYYLWESDVVKRLLQEFVTSQTIEITDSDIHLALKVHQTKWRNFISILISLMGGIIYFVSRSDLKSWGSSGILQKIASTLFGIFSTYATSMLLLGLTLNIWIIQKVLKNKDLKINPLHPDRCGGLSCLSKYSLKTAYLAGVFGVMIGFTEYRVITQELIEKYWILHMSIPIYILISLICFFGPLLVAHKQMKEAKDRMLTNIAQQFQYDYMQINTNLSLSAEELKKEIAKIGELQSLYTLTDKFLVWPFDLQTLSRYVLSVVTPLIPPLIGLIQKFGVEIFKLADFKI